MSPMAASYPERTFLYNLVARHTYRMGLRESKEIWGSGGSAGLVTESAVMKAFLFRAPLVSFPDGKPANEEDRLTLVVDGEKVLNDVPVGDFVRPDARMILTGISDYLFLETSASDMDLAPLSNDAIKAQALGLFLPNGTNIVATVRTERKVEIGLLMAEYEALL